MEIILQPWPWYVSGSLISLVLFALLYMGQSFGVSSNLRTFCTIAGAGKVAEFFRFNWRQKAWGLLFVLGAVIGGYIAQNFLSTNEPVQINPAIVQELENYNVQSPNQGYMPEGLFTFEALQSPRGLILLLFGGFLVGFGTRYAGGCTSGHAITGLSHLQLPSLIAVVGFFIGGLIATYLLLPVILTL